MKEDEGAGDVPFREVVGSLMWIASQTRPDISNSVRAVARHSHEPKKSHWKAAQKILNYLLETAHLTLKFKRHVGSGFVGGWAIVSFSKDTDH
eukprot:g19891.t1